MRVDGAWAPSLACVFKIACHFENLFAGSCFHMFSSYVELCHVNHVMSDIFEHLGALRPWHRSPVAPASSPAVVAAQARRWDRFELDHARVIRCYSGAMCPRSQVVMLDMLELFAILEIPK